MSEHGGTELGGMAGAEMAEAEMAQADVAQADVAQADRVQNESALDDVVPADRLSIGADDAWMRVSPRYVIVEVVSTVLFGVVTCGIAAFLWLVAGLQWAAFIGAALALITVVSVIVLPRRVRSIGYQLRTDDLLFRRGIMFQRFVSVPYGRMQLVDITRGPVARWLGLADLKFVTAAASSGVAIPGLAEADAEALRDRLVELAESRRAGL